MDGRLLDGEDMKQMRDRYDYRTAKEGGFFVRYKIFLIFVSLTR